MSEITCCTVVHNSAIIKYAMDLQNPKSQLFYYAINTGPTVKGQ